MWMRPTDEVYLEAHNTLYRTLRIALNVWAVAKRLPFRYSVAAGEYVVMSGSFKKKKKTPDGWVRRYYS
jgi:hypothetical protein